MQAVGRKKKICMVSIDVEGAIGNAGKKTFLGVENLDTILKIFEVFQIEATLFVTGEVLGAYPYLIERWLSIHEIACHGYYHTRVYELPLSEREKQLEDFCRLYERIISGKPKGFRAVEHTIDSDQLRLLGKFGFSYDSSVIPSYPLFRRYVGYKGRAPREPYHPDEEDYRREGDMAIMEIPVTPLIFGVPLSGTWIRMFGSRLYRTLLALKKPSFVSLAMHSWDCIEYKGPYSRNSGARFSELLLELLEVLAKSYVFVNGSELVEVDARLGNNCCPSGGKASESKEQ